MKSKDVRVMKRMKFDLGYIPVDMERVPENALMDMQNVHVRKDGSLKKRGGSCYWNDVDIKYTETIKSIERIDAVGNDIYIIDKSGKKIWKYNGGNYSVYFDGFKDIRFEDAVGGSHDFLYNAIRGEVYDLNANATVSVSKENLDSKKIINLAGDNGYIVWNTKNIEIVLNNVYYGLYVEDLNIEVANPVEAVVHGDYAYIAYVDYQSEEIGIILLDLGSDDVEWSKDKTTSYDPTVWDIKDIAFHSNPTAGVYVFIALAMHMGESKDYLIPIIYDGSSLTFKTSEAYNISNSHPYESLSADEINNRIYAVDEDGKTASSYSYNYSTGVFSSVSSYDFSTFSTQLPEKTIDFDFIEDSIVMQTNRSVIKKTRENHEILYQYSGATDVASIVKTHKGVVFLREGQRPLIYHLEYGLLNLSIEETPTYTSYTSGSVRTKAQIRLVVIDGDGNIIYEVDGDYSDEKKVDATKQITVKTPTLNISPSDSFRIDLYVYRWDGSDWILGYYKSDCVQGQSYSFTLGNGEVMSEHGLLPPHDPAKYSGIGAYWQTRLIIAYENKIYWSDTDINSFDENYWYLTIGDESDIVALAAWRNYLYIFKANGKIWELRGNLPTFAPTTSGRETINLQLRQIPVVLNQVHRKSIVVYGRLLFFADRIHAYVFDGYDAIPISINLKDFLTRQYSEIYGSIIINRYGVYYAICTTPYILLYEPQAKRWEKHNLIINILKQNGEYGEIFGALYNSNKIIVAFDENSTTDMGSAINASATIVFNDDPLTVKNIVFLQAGTNSANFTIYNDKSNALVGGTIYSHQKARLNGLGRVFKIVFTGFDYLYSCFLGYKIKFLSPKWASTKIVGEEPE